MIAWWAHVTLTPEETNTIVFKRGTWKGLKVKIPEGGHTPPNSTAGDSLLWKNAQKNLKKKKTSETINNNIPHRISIYLKEFLIYFLQLKKSKFSFS